MRPRHRQFGLNLLPSALPVFRVYFGVVTVDPYRIDLADSPWCKFAGWFVRTSATCRQSLFEKAAAGVLQVPERQKKYWNFGGFA